MKELQAIQSLTDSFHKLPGVGPRSAERMAYAVLAMSEEDKLAFIDAIAKVKDEIHPCPICGLYAEGELCDICGDPNRDHGTICVVSNEKDALAIEKMESYKGVYHVLGGLLNASKGISMGDLRIDSLLSRVKEGGVKEVILALSATLEGETTSLFLAKLLEKENVLVTRLGYGLPMGASLDYADSLTLGKAFEGRKKL